MTEVANPGPTIEADQFENDSTIGSEVESSTTSLASSIMNYQFENGRRYHAYKSGKYVVPNDEQELDRMDLEHHMITILLNGKLYLAPLESPQKILDIGCGTGIWTLDVADKFPSAHVIGTDLSPVQPRWVPPNVQFEIDDAESEWTFRDNSFDLIHWRLLIAGIADYPLLFGQAFRATKPGGYCEIQELDPHFYSDDGSLHPDSSIVKWGNLVCEGSAKNGRPVPRLDQYKTWMEEAGFVDVKETYFKRASNSWPKDPHMKEIGKFQLLHYLEGLHGLSIGIFTRVLHWKPEEVEVLLAQMRRDLQNRSIHSYQPLVVVYGRKPEKTE